MPVGLALRASGHSGARGRFPDEEADLAPVVIAHLGVVAESIEGYAFTGRSGRGFSSRPRLTQPRPQVEAGQPEDDAFRREEHDDDEQEADPPRAPQSAPGSAPVRCLHTSARPDFRGVAVYHSPVLRHFGAACRCLPASL